MKVLLVANYRCDEQQSMLRFADALAAGLVAAGIEVRTVRPEPWLLALTKGAPEAVRKWVAYLDKFVLFGPQLTRLSTWADVVHICDHSNAMYTSWAPGAVVTCHDLLAVRGALGEDTDCPASATGKLLQRWIVSGLRRAGLVVCDSAATLADLRRLVGSTVPATVVLLGLNHPYGPLDPSEAERRLLAWPDLLTKPFVLHVGSNLARKNREGVLRIFAGASRRWDGLLVLAGEPPTPALLDLACQLGIKERLVAVPAPTNAVLEALYNRAQVLLFPSRFEGFGWPPIEAQRCGCPVISSDCTSLPEVVVDSALVFALDQEAAMADAIVRLADPEERRVWSERGLLNVERFRPERMIADYIALYRQVARR